MRKVRCCVQIIGWAIKKNSNQISKRIKIKTMKTYYTIGLDEKLLWAKESEFPIRKFVFIISYNQFVLWENFWF